MPAEARGVCKSLSNSASLAAMRKLSSLAGLPSESSPISTKSLVLVTSAQPVLVPVLAHLLAVCRQPGVILGRLDLDNPAFRDLPLPRRSFLHLLGGVEADVGVTGALVGKLDNAEDLGFERGAHGVEQVGQRRVVGQFRRGAAGGAHLPETGQVLFNGWRQFRPAHPIPQRFTRAAAVSAVKRGSII